MLPYKTCITDDREFEVLCHDLLWELGFSNVVLLPPGPDGGRDIEADWYFDDASGHTVRQEWYIECKFYETSNTVSFTDVEPKLTAAVRDNKDFLLLITSSSLRNTAKTAVEDWLRQREAVYKLRFRHWNAQDLARRLFSSPRTLQTYFPKHLLGPTDAIQAELARQRTLMNGVQARVQARVLGLAQLLEGNLAVEESLPGSDPGMSRMRRSSALLCSLVQSLGVLGNGARVQTTETTLAEVTQSLRALCADLGWDPRVDWVIADCRIVTSQSLILTCLYELLENAVRFAQAGSRVTVSAVVKEKEWSVEIGNTAGWSLDAGAQWPLFGHRSAGARAAHPSGMGLGCWIVRELTLVIGHSVSWHGAEGRWSAKISSASP